MTGLKCFLATGIRLSITVLFALVFGTLAALAQGETSGEATPAAPTDLDAPSSPSSSAANEPGATLPDVVIQAPAPEPEPPPRPAPTPAAPPPAPAPVVSATDADAAEETGAPTGDVPFSPSISNPELLLDQSITTFDEDEIRSQDIGLLNDLSARVPNLNASDTNLRGFNNVYNLRGLGNTLFFSAPAVVTYVDGVPLGNAFAYATDFYDIEAIEVYRGPQPTLFGRNSSAGVINVRTIQPTNTYRANATIGYGSFESQEYVAGASGPIVRDNFYVGLGGYLTSSEGYTYNTVQGKPLDDRDAIGGRVQLRYTPAENWDISVFADIDQYTDGDVGLTPLGGPNWVQTNPVGGQTRISRNTIALRVAGEYDWGTVTSATARQWFDLSPNFVDISPFVSAPAGTGRLTSATTLTDQQQEQWTTELRFASPADAQGPLRWQAGFFYLTSEINNQGTNGLETLLTIPFFGNIPFDFSQTTSFSLDEENVAFFGDVGLSLTEQLELIFGLRLDYTEKSLNDRKRFDAFTNSLAAPPLNASRSEFNPAPSIGLGWTPCEQSRVWWNTTYGFQSGGFSGFADTLGEAEFDTQTLLANEIGAEWENADGTLRAGVTGFYYHIWDYQVERTTIPPQYLILNAPESRSLGAEASAAWEPLPGLVLSGVFGYTNFEFLDYTDPFTGQDFAGHTAPFVPEFNGTVAAQYRHETGVFARLEMQAFGETFYDEANSPQFRQGSYVLLNAKTGWENDHVGVYFVGRNLTDTFYFTNITPNLAAGVPGTPQYVGFEVTGRF
ncbi:MAG: TonB-dependent receptor plug domain-containing protein [Verrucomicrobiota bacterium]